MAQQQAVIKNPTVFIAGGFNPMMAGFFYQAGWRGVRALHDADLVCFTGGADIDPGLYHENKIAECGNPNYDRDRAEIKVFENAKTLDIPMVGICRGAQLLNVLNGGRLYQHVDGHTRDHLVHDIRTKENWKTTSTHHQMMRPTQEAKVLAIATNDGSDLSSSLCSMKLAENVRLEPGIMDYDPEVVWYEDTHSLCFQGHPEYNSRTNTQDWFWRYMNEFIIDYIA